MASILEPDLIDRLRSRAADPARRTDAASISANADDLGTLLARLGPGGSELGGTHGQLQGFMGQFAKVMTGFGVVSPMPSGDGTAGRDLEPAPAPATEAAIAAAELAIGQSLPDQLKQLYSEIADGGFGPCAGLFPLARLTEEYLGLTREPVGPQNQPWPPKLLPLVDREPGYDCLDLESGEVIAWDPEEIEGYSNSGWRRSFRPEAPNLSAWLDEWLNRSTSGLAPPAT